MLARTMQAINYYIVLAEVLYLRATQVDEVWGVCDLTRLRSVISSVQFLEYRYSHGRALEGEACRE
jgi:hypothetical protein